MPQDAAPAHRGAMRHIDIPTARAMLWTRDALEYEGWSARDISRGIAVGRLHHLRRGVYVDGPVWAELWPESQHLLRVVAVDETANSRPVFALASAAVVHGYTLYRVRTDRVHTVHPDAARRSVGDVVRHRASLGDDEITEIDGIHCTSAARTAWDLARLASPEVAVSCLDAALGRIGGDPRRYDRGAADAWRASLIERADAVVGARGVRGARSMFEIADGRSQLPLEAVTKLQFRRLGFRQPGLQVRVPAQHGDYWMDIEVEEAGAFYECDGETKYTDEALRSGRSLEQVLLDEKRREDWVRGVTRRRVLRGGSAHAATPEALASRLASFGVELPDRRVRLLLPRVPLLTGQ